jgi:RNase P/RNase MRP subunit POP5
MTIRTIEEDFEYQMREVINKFKKDFKLEELTGEEIQEKIWNKYSKEFGRAVLEACNNYSGDELFEEENE